MEQKKQPPKHLAWHETMEVHELVAFQSIGIIKLKKAYPKVSDPKLKDLYQKAINGLSSNVRELLEFYPLAPSAEQTDADRNIENAFYSGDLLALFKAGVRNYAIAITETATPELRKVLKQQLNRTIDTHAHVYSYMYQNGYYPSYDLNALLNNDIKLAKKALSQSI